MWTSPGDDKTYNGTVGSLSGGRVLSGNNTPLAYAHAMSKKYAQTWFEYNKNRGAMGGAQGSDAQKALSWGMKAADDSLPEVPDADVETKKEE
jgi:hypothetical protein